MFIKNGSFRTFTHIISYVPPTILVQPISAAKTSGENYTFEIKVRGSRPIKYQWYKNNFPLINQNNKQLILENVTSLDQAYYYCKVSNNRYYVESNIVPLSVIQPPYIITQPISVLSALDSNILFNVSALGTEPLTYTWYKNDIVYPYSTSENLYINRINYENEGNYYVTITNEFGSVTSLSASLKIADPIVIVTQPTNLTVTAPSTATFTLSCTGIFPISSRWRKDNTFYNLLSSNNQGLISLNINDTQLSDIGYYDCILSNNYYSVTSEKVYLYVNKIPVFTLNPISVELPLGETVTFTVNASGTEPISYKWIKIGTGEIPNEISKTYTIPHIILSDEAEYACVATNLVGSTTSNFAALSVIQSPIILGDDDPYEIILLDQNVYWLS